MSLPDSPQRLPTDHAAPSPGVAAACPFHQNLFARQDVAKMPLGKDRDLSLEEAGRHAWRESARCIGRLHWQSLQVVDATSLERPDEIFEALVAHLGAATNDGRIKPRMTVFAPWKGCEMAEVRVWNHQLCGYAGYSTGDGTILGDPANAAMTRVALLLGWKPPLQPGRFDLLPLIVQAGGRLQVFPLPEGAVREVSLRHPRHSWFEELNLRWYAVPAIADMIFATSTATHPCAPFNGWYMGTEIGARNLGDEARYHQLPVIAERLGLDTRRSQTLWKDHAVLVLNEAVLWSYEQEGVRLVDHHQAAREFMEFCGQEERQDRKINADWSWIVPPVSGSTTPVFHQTYEVRPVLPNFLLQKHPWQTARGWRLLRHSVRR